MAEANGLSPSPWLPWLKPDVLIGNPCTHQESKNYATDEKGTGQPSYKQAGYACPSQVSLVKLLSCSHYEPILAGIGADHSLINSEASFEEIAPGFFPKRFWHIWSRSRRC